MMMMMMMMARPALLLALLATGSGTHAGGGDRFSLAPSGGPTVDVEGAVRVRQRPFSVEQQPLRGALFG